MKTLLAISAWFILLALCWPLAVFALVLWPVVLLISLPFLLVGFVFTGIFNVFKFFLLLPFRLMGWRSQQSQFARA